MPTRKPTAAAWHRLGAAVKASREAQRLTQREVADRSDVAIATVQYVEAGHEFTRQPKSIGHITEALGWPSGWWQLILSGKETSPPTAHKTVKAGRSATDPTHATVASLSQWIGANGVVDPKIPTSELLRLQREITETLSARLADDGE